MKWEQVKPNKYSHKILTRRSPVSELSALRVGGEDTTSVVDGTGFGSSMGGFSSSTVVGTASTLYVRRSLSGNS